MDREALKRIDEARLSKGLKVKKANEATDMENDEVVSQRVDDLGTARDILVKAEEDLAGAVESLPLVFGLPSKMGGIGSPAFDKAKALEQSLAPIVKDLLKSLQTFKLWMRGARTKLHDIEVELHKTYSNPGKK